jgi:1-pyrroline-5-carboxylate dehydrogenase
MWNRLDHRPLEGFVYAITPFNFTAIAGNLPTAPAMLGNVALWKPASTAVYSGWHIMKLLEEAGLPPGVINFIPGDPGPMTETVLGDRALAGIHFTGSTGVFQTIWRTVGERIAGYRTYPRLVGETGGKDFILAHPSADPVALAVAIVRGGFEYQGQKCSAASRVYVPESLWPEVRERTLGMMGDIRQGDPRDFRNFMGAVIDRKAFDKISGYIRHARGDADGVEILAGGGCDDSKGYFIEPTLVQSRRTPRYQLMCEEVFGPVVALHVFPDGEWDRDLRLVDESSPVRAHRRGLLDGAGAAGAGDPGAAPRGRQLLRERQAHRRGGGAAALRRGARQSGTNDKAGSILNLIRWISPRTIKETFAPPPRWARSSPRARRGAGDDRHVRLRRRPLAPALRPLDALRAPGHRCTSSGTRSGRRRDHRVQLPGGGLGWNAMIAAVCGDTVSGSRRARRR